jgi:hypothetical protein
MTAVVTTVKRLRAERWKLEELEKERKISVWNLAPLTGISRELCESPLADGAGPHDAEVLICLSIALREKETSAHPKVKKHVSSAVRH